MAKALLLAGVLSLSTLMAFARGAIHTDSVAAQTPSTAPGTARWPRSSVNVYYQRNPTDQALTEDAIKFAIESWNRASPGTFSFRYAGQLGSNMHSCTSPVGGVVVSFKPLSGGVAGVAEGCTDRDGYLSQVDVRLNSQELWAVVNPIPAGLGSDLYTAMLHEFGHALGLWDHSNNPQAVMAPGDRIGSRLVRRSLTADDIQRVKALYPNTPLAVTPKSPYKAGDNAVVVKGKGTVQAAVALVEAASGKKVTSFWALLGGRWKLYVPDSPNVANGAFTLKEFPGPTADAIVTLRSDPPRRAPLPTPAAVPPPVTAPANFTITLTASTTDALSGQHVTLTATTNRDVSGTPYGIKIAVVGGWVVEWCEQGTTCTGVQYQTVEPSLTFRAFVARRTGLVGVYHSGPHLAESSDVLVTWRESATVPPPVTPPSPSAPPPVPPPTDGACAGFGWITVTGSRVDHWAISANGLNELYSPVVRHRLPAGTYRISITERTRRGTDILFSGSVTINPCEEKVFRYD